MRESTLEAKLIAYAKSKNCLAYKFSSPSQRGVPDRVFIAPTGKVLFMEIKAPGKSPSKLQQWEMLRIQSCGANVHWTDNYDKGVRFIDSIL